MITIFARRIKKDNFELGRIRHELEKNLESIMTLEMRKSKFMRYSAHQLRSPLATIISALNVLSKKLIPISSDRATNLIDGAHVKAKSLLNIVKDLLSLSRIREEKKNLVFTLDINIISMIEKIIYSYNQDIEKKKLQIKRIYTINDTEYINNNNFLYHNEFVEHLDSLPEGIMIKGNKDHLKDAFMNLIQNAIKYSYQDSIITVELSFNKNMNRCLFIISDQGIGIDKDYIDDIFLEFVRSPNAKNFQTEGTGLGLAIAKEIFEAHGAEIKVSSIRDKGTKFTVSFNLSGVVLN